MNDTVLKPFLSEPTEELLGYRHKVLRDMLSNKGELSRQQSDYAVLLSYRLIDAVKKGDVNSSEHYHNDTSSPLYKLRQEQLPVIPKPGPYAQFEVMQRADIAFKRKGAGDEFHAAQALTKVMQKADDDFAVDSALQLTVGLAFIRARQEFTFKEEAEEFTGMPLSVGKHVYNLVRFDSSYLKFQTPEMA